MPGGRGRYGDGALWQLDDGSWRGAVDLGRDPDTGLRVRKWVRGRTKGEATRKLADLRDKYRAGELSAHTRRGITVSEWLSQWLSGPARLRLGEDMQRRYAQICRDHINTTHPTNRVSPLEWCR